MEIKPITYILNTESDFKGQSMIKAMVFFIYKKFLMQWKVY